MVIPLSTEFLKVLHKTVLEDDPKTAPGYKQESMIEGSMQTALTKVYGYEPFESIIDNAAALMISINVYFIHSQMDVREHHYLLSTSFSFSTGTSL